MPHTDTPVPFELPLEVDVTRIEYELRRIWQSAAEEAGQTGLPPVTRACVANLAIVVDDTSPPDTHPNTITEVVAAVTSRHPCRVILIHVQPEETPALLHAHLSAFCQKPREGRRICCEQIRLDVGPSALPQIPGAVFPLLAPDVPSYLWWTGPLNLKHPLYCALSESLEHLLFDSDVMRAPVDDLAQLLTEMTTRGDSISLRDINWARLTPWRQLTAQFFDSADRESLIRGIELVALDAGSCVASICPQALLFAGWIAARLGWRFTGLRSSGNRFEWFFMDERPVSVVVRSHAQTEAALINVSLRSRVNGQEASFCISKADDGISASVTEQTLTGEVSHRRVRMRHRTLARLIGDEMDLIGKDSIYEQSLAAAAAILKEIPLQAETEKRDGSQPAS